MLIPEHKLERDIRTLCDMGARRILLFGEIGVEKLGSEKLGSDSTLIYFFLDDKGAYLRSISYG